MLPLPFFSASNLPGCLMPGRIGLSSETPSPYLPDPDQRLPGFARAALLENVKNCRSRNPGNPRKDRPKKDFFQLPCCGGPFGPHAGLLCWKRSRESAVAVPGPDSNGTVSG